MSSTVSGSCGGESSAAAAGLPVAQPPPPAAVAAAAAAALALFQVLPSCNPRGFPTSSHECAGRLDSQNEVYIPDGRCHCQVFVIFVTLPLLQNLEALTENVLSLRRVQPFRADCYKLP